MGCTTCSVNGSYVNNIAGTDRYENDGCGVNSLVPDGPKSRQAGIRCKDSRLGMGSFLKKVTPLKEGTLGTTGCP